jgi:hypothetical protein
MQRMDSHEAKFGEELKKLNADKEKSTKNKNGFTYVRFFNYLILLFVFLRVFFSV